MIRQDSRGAGRGTLTTAALLAAATGAGVALLFAPEEGTRTRRKVGQRLERLQHGARRGLRSVSGEIEERRGRARRQRRRRTLLTTLGLLAGAGIALLFVPAGPARLADGVRDAARGARRRLTRRREIDIGPRSSFDEPRRPVRTVQELDRDPTDVF